MDNGMDPTYGVPKWNFVVLPNFFEGDDYWHNTIEEQCPEAFKALSNLKNNYEKPLEWVQACKIYEKYIGEIIDYYGGKAAVQAMMDDNGGEYPIGIRERPKLLKKKHNRLFRKTGQLPPDQGKTMVKNLELGDEIAKSMYPEDFAQVEKSGVEVVHPKGKMKKVLTNDLRSVGSENRVNNIYGTSASLSLDIVSRYYNEHDDSFGDDEYFKRPDKTLDELAEEYMDSINEDGWEEEYLPSTKIHNGVIMTRKALTTLEIAKVLQANGFDVQTKKMLKDMPSDTVKLIRRELGESVLTKKQRKKSRKQYKRYQEEREKRAKADRDLSQSLTKSRLYLNNSMKLDDLLDRKGK